MTCVEIISVLSSPKNKAELTEHFGEFPGELLEVLIGTGEVLPVTVQTGEVYYALTARGRVEYSADAVRMFRFMRDTKQATVVGLSVSLHLSPDIAVACIRFLADRGLIRKVSGNAKGLAAYDVFEFNEKSASRFL